jgi:hypothetical protein
MTVIQMVALMVWPRRRLVALDDDDDSHRYRVAIQSIRTAAEEIRSSAPPRVRFDSSALEAQTLRATALMEEALGDDHE